MTGSARTGFKTVPQKHLGGILSLLGNKKREGIYQSVAQQRSGKSALNGISWQEFALLVGQWFRNQGYEVTETGGIADGGVDLVISQHGETHLVQCKQWKAFKVGVSIVRELLGVIVAQGASGGYIVTSGVFTQEASRFAADCNIQLIDGSRLSDLIRDSQRDKTKNIQPIQITPIQSADPACPKCGSSMILRKATRGP